MLFQVQQAMLTHNAQRLRMFVSMSMIEHLYVRCQSQLMSAVCAILFEFAIAHCNENVIRPNVASLLNLKPA